MSCPLYCPAVPSTKNSDDLVKAQVCLWSKHWNKKLSIAAWCNIYFILYIIDIEDVFSYASRVAQCLAMSVCRSVRLSLDLSTTCNAQLLTFLHRHSWLPEDVSRWFWSFLVFSSSTTVRFTFMQVMNRLSWHLVQICISGWRCIVVFFVFI